MINIIIFSHFLSYVGLRLTERAEDYFYFLKFGLEIKGKQEKP